MRNVLTQPVHVAPAVRRVRNEVHLQKKVLHFWRSDRIKRSALKHNVTDTEIRTVIAPRSPHHAHSQPQPRRRTRPAYRPRRRQPAPHRSHCRPRGPHHLGGVPRHDAAPGLARRCNSTSTSLPNTAPTGLTREEHETDRRKVRRNRRKLRSRTALPGRSAVDRSRPRCAPQRPTPQKASQRR